MQPTASNTESPARPQVLVIGCGAIARELTTVLGRIPVADYTLECLPGILHNRPEKIGPALDERLRTKADRYDQVLLGYADCGTRGDLDRLIDAYPNVSRIPGAHCYEFLSGTPTFEELSDPFTFYLTDYLTRHFDLFVWKSLGLDRWPHLRDDYFRHYRRVVYLSQAPTSDLLARASEAAERLGLEFEHVPTGLDPLTRMVDGLTRPLGRNT